MEFDDSNRKTADNMTDYLKEIKVMGSMMKWVWDELINEQGKSYARKMFWLKVISCAVAVISPYTLSYVFDGLDPRHPNLEMIYFGIISFVVVLLITWILNYFSWRYREYLFGENQRQLDKRTTELFLEKSLGTHQDESNLLTDANIRKGYERVFNLELTILFEGIESVLMLIFPFIALWVISWKIGLITSGMMVCYMIWSLFLNQRMMKETIPIDRKWRKLHRHRVMVLDKVERVKNEHCEEKEVDTLGEMFKNVIQPDRKFWFWFIDHVIVRATVTYLILAAIIIMGCYQVWTGIITLGLLYPIYNWSRQIADNLWRIGHIEHLINFVTPSILAMKEALTLPVGIKTVDNPVKLPKSEPVTLKFDDVSYEYPVNDSETEDDPRKLKVLTNISFDIKPGEIVGFAGESGVGKSTIVKLILHYMDPTNGNVLINDNSLHNVDQASWLSQIGYIPQQAQVFDGSIRDNLLYGVSNVMREISDEELWKLIKPLQLDFGTRLIDGLQTKVGRNGIKLSGGQAQRLMIGAAILKKPTFLLIDEATSSLDPTTERLVQEGLEEMTPSNIGVLYVTHRLQPMRRWCNKFIYLESNGDDSAHIAGQAKSFEDLVKQAKGFRNFAKDADIIL